MIHIFIPVFNEEASIEKLIKSIYSEFEHQNKKFTLLIVDDGSTDNTSSIIKKFTSKTNFSIITHNLNKGLGDSERIGFETLAMKSHPEDIIIRVEGDDTHDAKYIFSIINKLSEGYDIVNTSRFQKGGGQKGISNYRSFISYGANIFMKFILRVKNVKDFSCGFRGYKAQALQDAFAIYGNSFLQLRGLGFTATLEILIKMKMLGCRFAEVPFELRYDQKRSSSKMVGSITAFGYLVMAVLYHWPFGGWRVSYNHIRKGYKKNREVLLKNNVQKGYEKFIK
jgi:dolichol-phosphate mannosyltransferase